MESPSDSENAMKAAEASEEKIHDESTIELNWNDDAENPYNWPKWRKNLQLASAAILAFTG
jgi:hypothetical protein